MIYFRPFAVYSCTVRAFCEHIPNNERSVIKLPHSDCQLLKISAAVCWHLNIYAASLRRFHVTSKISCSKDLGYLSRCWLGFPCSGILLRRAGHIRAVCCICLQSSRRSVTNMSMEIMTSSETFKRFDTVLTDETYRYACEVACVMTTRTTTTTLTMYNSFYLLCTGHISHDPFLPLIPFDGLFMRALHCAHRFLRCADGTPLWEICTAWNLKYVPEVRCPM